jgi:type IV secretory pathway VirB10-like protein
MTTQGPNAPPEPESPEALRLRARPAPVTRINRKMLIGGAAVLLLLISLVVLAALRPPSLRLTGSQELYNVDHKPITEALSKLPATYDGVRPDRPAVPVVAKQDPVVPQLKVETVDPAAEAARVEQARVARLAGQARESPLFFRLQLKALPRDTPRAEVRSEVPFTPPVARPGDGDLATLTALRAAERARALGAGDLVGTDTADQTRKLTFLKAGPEKEIYNPHALQTLSRPTS